MSKTFYVFFIIDKSKFYRDSTVWIKDIKLIKNEFSKLIKNREVDSDTKLLFEQKEDPIYKYS